MILSLLGSSVTTSQQDNDYKDGRNELRFPPLCTNENSRVKTDWLALSQTTSDQYVIQIK